MKLRGAVYNLGVIISFLGFAGLAEAITGQGSHMGSIAFIGIGIIMCLFGYVK